MKQQMKSTCTTDQLKRKLAASNTTHKQDYTVCVECSSIHIASCQDAICILPFSLNFVECIFFLQSTGYRRCRNTAEKQQQFCLLSLSSSSYQHEKRTRRRSKSRVVKQEKLESGESAFKEHQAGIIASLHHHHH